MDASAIQSPGSLSRRVAGYFLFSPQNKRFTLLVLAVTCVAISTMASISYLATHNGSTAISMVIGFAGPVVIVHLIGMARQEQTADETRQRQEASAEEARQHRLLIEAEIKKTRHDLRGEMQAQSLKMDEVVKKTNGGLSHAVEVSGEKVRVAERDQIVNDPDYRKALAADLCPLLADEVTSRILEAFRNGDAGPERRIDRPPYPKP